MADFLGTKWQGGLSTLPLMMCTAHSPHLFAFLLSRLGASTLAVLGLHLGGDLDAVSVPTASVVAPCRTKARLRSSIICNMLVAARALRSGSSGLERTWQRAPSPVDQEHGSGSSSRR